MAERSSSRL